MPCPPPRSPKYNDESGVIDTSQSRFPVMSSIFPVGQVGALRSTSEDSTASSIAASIASAAESEDTAKMGNPYASEEPAIVDPAMSRFRRNSKDVGIARRATPQEA